MIEIEDLLKRFNIEYVREKELGEVLGLLIPPKNNFEEGWKILVEKNQTIEEQQMTVLHEIAEIMFRDDRFSKPDNWNEAKEFFCENFANIFLPFVSWNSLIETQINIAGEPEGEFTKSDLIFSMNEIFAECTKIAKLKNSDYAAIDNAFHNFYLCERLGICTLEEGILVRLSDKMARVSNLINKDPEVKDESIEDTLLDIVNYSAILLSYIRKKNEENEDDSPSE